MADAHDSCAAVEEFTLVTFPCTGGAQEHLAAAVAFVCVPDGGTYEVTCECNEGHRWTIYLSQDKMSQLRSVIATEGREI
jgi:hypothetical protein